MLTHTAQCPQGERRALAQRVPRRLKAGGPRTRRRQARRRRRAPRRAHHRRTARLCRRHRRAASRRSRQVRRRGRRRRHLRVSRPRLCTARSDWHAGRRAGRRAGAGALGRPVGRLCACGHARPSYGLCVTRVITIQIDTLWRRSGWLSADALINKHRTGWGYTVWHAFHLSATRSVSDIYK